MCQAVSTIDFYLATSLFFERQNCNNMLITYLNKLKSFCILNPILLLILVIAAVVRYWAIDFGLPQPDCRLDEKVIIKIALGFFSGDFNPHFFNYPTLYMYFLFGLYTCYFGLRNFFLPNLSQYTPLEEFNLYPTNFFLIDRSLSAFCGVVTVFVVYLIAKNLFCKKIAIISSLFLSLVHLHVRDSHFGVTDVTMALFVMCSTLYIVKSYKETTLKNYAIAGFFAGLAASTKYIGVLLLIPMYIVHLFKVLDHEKNEDWNSEIKTRTILLSQAMHYGIFTIGSIFIVIGFAPNLVELYLTHNNKFDKYLLSQIIHYFQITALLIGCCLILLVILTTRLVQTLLPAKVKLLLVNLLDKRILFFTGLLVFTFLLGTPFSLLDFPTFMSDFLYEVRHINSESGQFGIFLGRGWWYHLRFSLFLGMGWSLFYASLAGILILIKSDIKKATILCAFPLSYYTVIGKGYTVFLRYTIPLLPFLCITAAVFLVAITDCLLKSYKSQIKTYITLFCVSLVILQSGYNVFQSNSLLAHKDSRLLASEWIYKNLQKGSSFSQVGWGKIYVKGYDYWDYNYEKSQFVDKNNMFPKYIIFTKSPLLADLQKKYPERGFKQIMTNNYLEEVFNRTNKGVVKLSKILKDDYYIKKVFQVININNEDNFFDQHDVFFLPFSGFKDIERPGPNIYIYEKKPNFKKVIPILKSS